MSMPAGVYRLALIPLSLGLLSCLSKEKKVDSKWCTRFIRQHDLSIGALDADRVSIDATMSLLTASNKSMRVPMCAPVVWLPQGLALVHRGIVFMHVGSLYT